MLLTVTGECNYGARGTDTGIASGNVLKMLFSSEFITNVNYVLDPSGVYFAFPEGDVCQNNRITNSFFFFLIDVSLLKLMCLSVYSVTVCLVA